MRQGGLLLVSFVCAITLFMHQALGKAKDSTAQSSTSLSTNVSQSKGEPLSADKQKLSTTLQMITSSSLYEPSSTTYSSALDTYVIATYLINKNLSATTALMLTLDLQTNDTTVLDTPLTLYYKKQNLSKNITYTPYISVILPSNEVNRIDNTFLTGVSLGSKFSSVGSVFNAPVAIDLKSTLKKNIHKFKRNNLGAANTEWTFTNSLILTKKLNKWSIRLTQSYVNNWDYFKNIKPIFLLEQSLTYQVSKTISATIGHSNSGRALGYDGVSNNISLFDGNSSQIFGVLTVLN